MCLSFVVWFVTRPVRQVSRGFNCSYFDTKQIAYAILFYFLLLHTLFAANIDYILKCFFSFHTLSFSVLQFSSSHSSFGSEIFPIPSSLSVHHSWFLILLLIWLIKIQMQIKTTLIMKMAVEVMILILIMLMKNITVRLKIQQYCGPNGPTASIFYGIWIKQSRAMVFIFNLDKISLKKLFPTMNI